MATVKTLRIAEVEPSDVVARTLNQALFEQVRLNDPPPVLFQKISGLGGYAADARYTEEREVVLSDHLSRHERVLDDTTCRELLAMTYLHETAHRLFFNEKINPGHDARFACLNLILLMRAEGVFPTHSPLWQRFGLYDFQDHNNDEISPVDAFSFIWTNACELHRSDLSAEALVLEIERRWQLFRQDVLARPARERRKEQHLDALRTALATERENRSWYRFTGAIAALLLLGAARILLRFL